MTIVGELYDSMGNDLSLGDLVEYTTDQGDRTAVLVWDAAIGAVIMVDVATDDADFFYEIGADAVTKIEPPMPLVATDGRVVFHYALSHPIYVPVRSDR